MKVIKPAAELLGIGPQASETEALRLIELAGRVCYKSEDKIGPGSAETLLKKLVDRGHTSVLEHASICIPCSEAKYEDIYDLYTGIDSISFESYTPGKKMGIGGAGYLGKQKNNFLFWANYRGILQNRKELEALVPRCLQDGYVPSTWRMPLGAEDLIKWGLQENEILERLPRYLRFTIRATCDRGVSHEFVRHRVLSFSQESTRYCNYNGKPMKFIMPTYDFSTNTEQDIWIQAMTDAEARYNEMIEAGAPPQIARSVLPNSLKTELVVTGTLEQWNHFFSLRLTEAAHPDMRVLAGEIQGVIHDALEGFHEDLPSKLLYKGLTA
jgi:thymidylate synthase (FAD)